ncbi:MAG TPA: TonB-dependent receptor [Bacteroidota bacterium]|nr:TonB-dependent receptor [Bacteroidota bacterium]
MKRTPYDIILIILLCSVWMSARGQVPSGVLSGKVIDAETKEPLVGANVALRGTVLGRVTNVDGSFRFQNLPVGVYTVVISMVGYETFVAANVEVAQQSEKTIHAALKPIVIQTDPIVVTASRREQSLQEVPVSIATVTAHAIAERNNVTLDEALRYVPGVNVLQDQINIRGSSGYSRGVGSRVLILFDGLPYLTGDTGEISWETIPIHQIQRIEVVKGAGSALYGSSALGGVINIITKEAGDKPQLRVRLFSGVYDQPRYQEWRWSEKARLNSGALVDYAARTGALQYVLSLHRSVDESYRQNDAYHRWSFYTKLKYDFTPYQSLTVLGNLLARTHGNFLWWKNLREATRPADAQMNTNVTTRRGNFNIAYREFASNDFFYTLKGMYFGNFWQDDSAGQVNFHSRSDVYQLELQGNYEPAKQHILTFGVTGSYTHVSSNIFSSPLGTGGAVYVQDEVALSEFWKLTLGARYDYQRVSERSSKGLLTPKVGMVFNPTSGTKLRAAYGAGFRYPSIGEWYTQFTSATSQVAVLINKNLQVEKSNTYEFGISTTLADFFSAELSLFRNDFDNLIEAGVAIRKVRPNPNDTIEVERPVIQFENVTKARIQGLELGLRIDWLKKFFSTEIGYTYTYPQDLTEQTVLKFRPRHLLYASGVVTYGYFRLSSDFRYISRIERIDENLVRLAPIIHGDRRVPIYVVDVRASYDLIDYDVPVRVGFNINNLLNYHYVELIGNLAPVRSYTLSLEGLF